MKANYNTNNLTRDEQIKILEVFFATENAEAIGQAQDNFINYLAENKIEDTIEHQQIEDWVVKFLETVNRSTNSIPDLIDDAESHHLVIKNICIPVIDKIGIKIERTPDELAANGKTEWLIIRFAKKFMNLMRNFFKKMKQFFINILGNVAHAIIDIGAAAASFLAGSGIAVAAHYVIKHFGWHLTATGAAGLTWQAGIIYLAACVLLVPVCWGISFINSILHYKAEGIEIDKETCKELWRDAIHV